MLIERDLQMLEDVTLSLITDRGGEPGATGEARPTAGTPGEPVCCRIATSVGKRLSASDVPGEAGDVPRTRSCGAMSVDTDIDRCM
jgi:hypothetical protein